MGVRTGIRLKRRAANTKVGGGNWNGNGDGDGGREDAGKWGKDKIR